MAKRIFILTIAILAVLLTGCRNNVSEPQQSAQTEQIANPIKTYESISKLNNALGFDMIELNPEFGFKAYEFATIDKSLGQIEYSDVAFEPDEGSEPSLVPQATQQTAPNKRITLRMAHGDDDISGIYGVEYETEDFNGIDVNIGVYENTVFIGWWIYQDYCYSIAAYNIDGNTGDEMISSLTAQILGIGAEKKKE